MGADGTPAPAKGSDSYVIGFDYGTGACRAVLMRPDSPQELALASADYPSGHEGVISDPADPHLARQNPADYLAGLTACVAQILSAARTLPGFAPDKIRALAFATTGSTVIPVDAAFVPLSASETFADNPNALAWLWKDHTSAAEAQRLTDVLQAERPHMIERCGGVYSSEWTPPQRSIMCGRSACKTSVRRCASAALV
ncbi:MAG: hypothetical protein AAGF49_14285 [Pseudomonadota bacterium]